MIESHDFLDDGPGHKRIQHPNIKKASKPRTLQDTFNDLLSNIQKPLGIHHIRTILLYPCSPKGEGGILFYLCPSFRPSKIFFVAFFLVTVDGRNQIFGHKHHIGIPYCG